MKNATNTSLCWNPGTDQVALVPHRRAHNYQCDHLACWGYVRGLSFEQRKQLIFIEAMVLIIRDKCDPTAVHRALLGLEEYRDGCPDDMPGLHG